MHANRPEAGLKQSRFSGPELERISFEMNDNKTLGKWHLEEQLGKGGNGIVFRAHSGASWAAIKLLRRQDRVGRFRDEIDGMLRLAGTPGVMPVLDYNVPSIPTKSNPAWFAMPLATPLTDALGPNPPPSAVINAIASLAGVLSEIHAKGFSHRDIKPDNLFLHNGVWVVGDFGLVDFEEKEHRTEVGERIGPMHFIAPEMLLGLPEMNGGSADVYSLAKTLWVLLTGANFPVPGAYSSTSQLFRLQNYLNIARSAQLDRLIEQCTTTEPHLRPSMLEFLNELSGWKTATVPAEAAVGGSTIPTGSNWLHVAEAAEVERQTRAAVAKVQKDTEEAVRAFYLEVHPLYLELAGYLQNAHLTDVSGPAGQTTPPGVVASFPSRSTSGNRVSFEFRVWFTPDWGKLEERKVKVVAIARLILLQGGSESREELFRLEDNFLIGGPSQSTYIRTIAESLRAQLGIWLEQGRLRWVAIG